MAILCALVVAGQAWQLDAIQEGPKTRDVRKDERFLALSWIQNSAENHRIIMLVGDSMSDLCSGMDEYVQEKRNATADEKTAMLGSRWIIMPNPVYGSWERALPREDAALRQDR